MGYLIAKKEYNSFCTSTDSFDDEKFAKGDPIGVEVRHGEIIDAIRFVYEGDDNPKHGGTGGDFDKFDLERDEYLTKIELICGNWVSNHQTVLEIIFTTSLNRTYTYGNSLKKTGTLKSYYFNNKPITSLVGKTIYEPSQRNTFIADLGVYYIDKFNSIF